MKQKICWKKIIESLEIYYLDASKMNAAEIIISTDKCVEALFFVSAGVPRETKVFPVDPFL